jgi:hypothetical protein
MVADGTSRRRGGINTTGRLEGEIWQCLGVDAMEKR